jgi:hypothetical protein
VKVLVCGGRDYADREAVHAALNAILGAHPHIVRVRPVSEYMTLIEGGAAGADTLAREWAYEHGVPVITFRADWKTHGRAAGPIRNQKMLDEGQPQLVVAFPGGRGTADMVGRAQRAGIRVAMVAVSR